MGTINNNISPTMKTLSLILVIGIASSVRAQEISWGQCPNFSVIQNFDTAQYLGEWYEYSNYFAIFQLFSDCVKANYTDISTSDETKIKVVNSGVNRFTNNPNVAEGSAVLGEPDNASRPGKLIVNFDSQPSFARSTETNYNIVDTDYTSYAVVYFCEQKFFDLFKTELLWILTRERIPSQAVIDKATSIIKAQGIDTKRLKKTR